MFECDVCGQDGERYAVQFPDGQLTLDRCPRHAAKIEKLRDEKGAWVAAQTQKRGVFRVASADDIRNQLK